MPEVKERRVTSSDGVSLAVYERGVAHRPTVLLVHGYPDNHAVWDAVADELAEDHHVVSYDVRGTGASDKPAERAAYRVERLVDDLFAVAGAVSPDLPVHVVGHDWGSTQAWEAMIDERAAARVRSFTSISGPSLTYGGVWLRNLRRDPRSKLRQIGHSYYVLLFQLPRLPELAVRSGRLDGALPEGVPHSEADKVNGLQLYRANVFPAFRRAPRPTRLPVQVIAPGRDPFVTPAWALESPRPFVGDLTTHRIDAGHWVIVEQPAEIARMVREFAAFHR
jgi:pimeloyl-ACP methyl ester carboxylesterase